MPKSPGKAFPSGKKEFGIAPAPGFWSDKPAGSGSERAAALLFFAFLFLIPLGYQFGVGFGSLLNVYLFIVIVVGVWDSKRELRASPADLRLIENPADSEICLVRLSIYDGERLVGRDRGIVWICDDRLHFTGHAASFALGGQDIVPLHERSSAPSTLTLRHPKIEAHLEFAPLTESGPSGQMRRECFRYRFDSFRRLGSPSTESRQWPPLLPWSGVK